MIQSIDTTKSEAFAKAIKYPAYRSLIKTLLAENKTTGPDHSEAMVTYTKMNDKRMDRWDKTLKLDADLVKAVKSLPKMKWMVITEGWCGDASQNLPFMTKLANENPNIDLRFILRDEHTEIIDQYLTNGGRSIPILVIMDEQFNDLATWGPRPAPVQKMVTESKKDPDLDQMKFLENVAKWYAQDKSQAISREFKELIKSIS